MKIFLPVLCSLLLIGCNDSKTVETVPADQNENKSLQVSAVAETNLSVDVKAEIPSGAAEISTSASEPDKTTAKPISAPKVEKMATPVPVPPTVTASVDGGALFGQKCASCHGAKAEKSALGKSQIIADFNEGQVKEALHGYQAGTYGKEMKGLMQGQVKGLSDGQIDALAKHISNL